MLKIEDVIISVSRTSYWTRFLVLLRSIKKRGWVLLEERANVDQKTQLKINDTNITINNLTEYASLYSSSLEIE